MENLPYHGNPNRTAAACQLVVPPLLHMLVELQRLLESKDVRKKRNLHHTSEAQSLKSRAQLSGSNPIAKLPHKCRSNQHIYRPFPFSYRLHRRNRIFTCRQISLLTCLYTGFTSYAQRAINLKPPILRPFDCVKNTTVLACLIVGAFLTLINMNNWWVFLWMKKAIQMEGVVFL